MRRRSTGIAAIILLIVFAMGCGETFRPIATPIPQPGGDPSNLLHAIVVSQNPGTPLPTTGCGTPAVAPCLGGASSIDTSGDSNVGNAVTGVTPVHAGFVSVTRTYVANLGNNTVTRILTQAPTSGSVTIPMPTGCGPRFVMSRNDGTAYIACPDRDSAAAFDSVVVLSVPLDSITAEVQLPAGSNPVSLNEAFNGSKVYSLNSGNGTVSVIATVDNIVMKTITVGGSPTWSSMNQDGSLLFVANAGGYVSVIDTNADALALPPVASVNVIAVGGNPTFVTFDANRRRLYVVNNAGNTISVIDAVATSSTFLSVIATIPVGADPRSATALRNGAKVYVSSCGSNTVSVIDATSLAVVKTITTGTCPIGLTSPTDSSRVIVGVQGAGTGATASDPPQILSISTQTDAVLVTLKPPQQDPSCAINPTLLPPVTYCPLQQPVFVTMSP
ncbi:MAG: YncE family protein [Acidobacteriota bacterium]|nr:YncE family protein [Acidobacteriota bacterium]